MISDSFFYQEEKMPRLLRCGGIRAYATERRVSLGPCQARLGIIIEEHDEALAFGPARAIRCVTKYFAHSWLDAWCWLLNDGKRHAYYIFPFLCLVMIGH